MKSNCHKLLFTMTYAKRFCEHFETQAVQHLLFTLKANLDIRCPMQSRPGLKMTTVCLNQHLNHQLQQPRLFFFRISYINV